DRATRKARPVDRERHCEVAEQQRGARRARAARGLRRSGGAVGLRIRRIEPHRILVGTGAVYRGRAVCSPPGMGAPELRGAASRLQRLGALVLGCAGSAALVWHCAASPEVTWIAQHGDAAWITDRRPVDLSVQQYGRPEVPVATFLRRFELAAAPAHAELRV